jgi:hypothetical protein
MSNLPVLDMRAEIDLRRKKVQAIDKEAMYQASTT